jgi:hypothetical protein
MTTDNFCFHLQNRLIQTSQTGGQPYSDTSLVLPGLAKRHPILSVIDAGCLVFYCYADRRSE